MTCAAAETQAFGTEPTSRTRFIKSASIPAARRPAGVAIDQIRVCHQPANGASTRYRGAARGSAIRKSEIQKPQPSRQPRRQHPRASPWHGGIAMSALMSLLRQLAGLFVDDGWLAFAILCIVAFAAVLALLTPRLSLAAGAVLVFGCLGVLLVNVIRAAQHERGL